MNVEVLDAAGPDITYKYTIKNQGTSNITSGFWNDVYLSTNVMISTADYRIDRWSHTGLNAGASYTTSTIAMYPTAVIILE